MRTLLHTSLSLIDIAGAAWIHHPFCAQSLCKPSIPNRNQSWGPQHVLLDGAVRSVWLHQISGSSMAVVGVRGVPWLRCPWGCVCNEDADTGSYCTAQHAASTALWWWLVGWNPSARLPLNTRHQNGPLSAISTAHGWQWENLHWWCFGLGSAEVL